VSYGYAWLVIVLVLNSDIQLNWAEAAVILTIYVSMRAGAREVHRNARNAARRAARENVPS
jgi:hypothetical protein